MSFYIAYKAEIELPRVTHGGHITMTFMSDPKDTKSLDMSELSEVYLTGTVKSVEYFQAADVTVAVVHCPELLDIRKSLESKGFTYTHEFRPHVTLCKGNKVEDLSELLGCDVTIGKPYLRFKEFK